MGPRQIIIVHMCSANSIWLRDETKDSVHVFCLDLEGNKSHVVEIIITIDSLEIVVCYVKDNPAGMQFLPSPSEL